MGRCSHFLPGLMNPFLQLEEWYLTIPAGQFLEVPNPDFKAVFFLEGETALSIPGHPAIELAKGDAYSLSLPVTQTYRSLRPGRDTHLHFLRLSFRWGASATPPPLSKPPQNKPEKRFEVALKQKLGGFQHFPHSLFGDHYQISRRILSEMDMGGEASVWKVSGLCQTLVAGLLSTDHQHRRRERSLPSRQGDAAVEHALQYLQENCHEALTLTSIAWHVQFSGEHLARLFKQETGRTVFTWLDYFRTEKARNLLTITEWPLSQIAHACGYSSANLLIRHFKKNVGVPPIIYRTKTQNGEMFSPSKLSSFSNDFQKLRNRSAGGKS